MRLHREAFAFSGLITKMVSLSSLFTPRKRAMFWVMLLVNLCLELTVVQGECTDAAFCQPNILGDLLDDNYPDYRSLNVFDKTCGFVAKETYQTIDTSDNEDYFCDLTNETIAYRKGFMYDSTIITGPTGGTKRVADDSTFWVSSKSVLSDGASPEEILILLNLTDRFLVTAVSLTFVSPHIAKSDGRADAIAFEKYDAATKTWHQMRMYAENCNDAFPGVPFVASIGGSQSPTTVYCLQEQFGGDTETQGLGNRNHVNFDPALDWQQEFSNDYNTQTYYVTSAVRVRLVKPASLLPLRSYYAIADLTVHGGCACYGHADTCIGPNVAQCQCAHNTMGDHCEQCLPLYNNKAWAMGTPASANVCEACDCNLHAQSCVYDAVKGYGVCQACEESTLGDFCEQCDPAYYRNPANQNPRLNMTGLNIGECQGFDGTSDITYNCSRWCIPCDCNTDGVTPTGGALCDVVGQCTCKSNVMGRRCDECKDTYWNLDPANTLGCTVCDCDPVGTLNSANLCDKASGACLCKANTEGQRCEACKSGSFLLTMSNPDGCTLCDCDIGGATSNGCHITSGACTCRTNIRGRTCREPANGFYVPPIDFYTFEAEFNQQSTAPVVERAGHGDAGATFTGTGFRRYPENSQISFLVIVESAYMYDLVLRYESASTWGDIDVSVTLQTPIAYQCGGVNYPTRHSFTSTINIPAAASAGSVTAVSTCLLANQPYIVTVAIKSPAIFDSNAAILLDSILFLPSYATMSAYSRADSSTQTKMADCHDAAQTVNRVVRTELGCETADYSIMAELLNGAIPCACDSLGTDVPILGDPPCSPIGGQCPCKTGVFLRDCSLCKVDHFDTDLQDGCQPCLCNVDGSVQTSCNETGHCSCRTNVIGVKCDSCIQDHYGLNTGLGCVPCTCHPENSIHNTCNDFGQCVCKSGVAGRDCTICDNGYYNLTREGCSQCGCNEHGSTQAACDKGDGTCVCKSLVDGNSCDHCKSGYYGLGPWNAAGCLKCVCSGHSTNCTSASGWYETLTQSTWSLIDGTAVDDPWQGEDESGRPITVDEPTIFFISLQVAQFVMRIKNVPMYLANPVLYFLAPATYLGDKKSSYGRELSVSLSSSSSDNILTDSFGDVVLKGTHADYALVTKLPVLPGNGKTKYTLILREEYWKVDRMDGASATFEQMMEVLSFLESLKIRGKFSNTTGAEVDLYAALFEYSSQDSSSGKEINNVEDCFCPQGYDGQFCELCAPGYRRLDVTSGPFGECVPCQCNGHGLGHCDIDTGACNCTDHTTGLLCDQCLPGFYGDATGGTPNDCFACLCPGNVVQSAVNVFATTCEPLGTGSGHRCIDCAVGHMGDNCETCIADYYGVPSNETNNGGRCVPCVCNGRADTCDSTTGNCIDCRNNTAGKECQICAPRYYGDAMIYTCTVCTNCGLDGATGECDHVSGLCECYPNVIGWNCTQCVENAYGYDDGEPGCSMCDCDPNGSYNPQTLVQDVSCNLTTGQCTCRPYVIGRQCNMCEDTYYQVNMQTGCLECGCDLQGTMNRTGETFGTCDLNTGQCECATPAVIGRTCDHCSTASTKSYTFVEGIYVGSFPACELCGECYDNWATAIDMVGFALEALNQQVLDIWTNYDNTLSDTVTPQLEQARTEITDAQDAINSAKILMEKLNSLKDGFNEVARQVGNLTQTSNYFELSRNQREAERMSLTLFDGSVITAEGLTRTMNDIKSYINAEAQRQLTQYSAGNKTWHDLVSISTIVKNFEARITEFRERVRVAKNTLTVAATNRENAENTMSGTFPTTYQGNQVNLDNQRTTLSGLEAIRGQAETAISSAETQISTANDTVQAALSIATQKRDNMLSKLEVSQTAKLNATEAQKNVGMAHSAVGTYKTKADSTKAELTRAVEKIVEGTQLTSRANGNVQEVTRLVQGVAMTTLRSLADLQTITTAIQGTSVSQAAVEAANQNATNALTVANQAQLVTEEAITKSHQALEDVRAIQRNLQDSGISRTETQNLMGAGNTAYNNVDTILTQVTTKSSSAHQRALDTRTKAVSLSTFITSVKTCLSSAQTDSENSKTVAQKASTLAISAAQQHVLNAGLVQNISQTLDMLKTQPGYTEAAEASQVMQILSNDLEASQHGADLLIMIDDLTEHTTRMQKLTAEVNQLEGDIDAILVNLERLTPETANCVAN